MKRQHSNLFTVANLPLVIKAVDKPNISLYSPPTQHRSFFGEKSFFHEVAGAAINIISMCTSEKHEDKNPQQQHIKMSTSTSQDITHETEAVPTSNIRPLTSENKGVQRSKNDKGAS